MNVYFNQTNRDLYILAVVYIMEFGHSPSCKIVEIIFGGCKGAKANKNFVLDVCWCMKHPTLIAFDHTWKNTGDMHYSISTILK